MPVTITPTRAAVAVVTVPIRAGVTPVVTVPVSTAVGAIDLIGVPGPSGPPGTAGAPGPAGPAGPAGSPGGPPGPTGPQGEQGDPGPEGADGAQGPAGPPGATGPAGTEGPEGDPGPAGATGAPGPEGAPGTQGPAGATGSSGAKGDPGDTGAQGPAGVQGVKGDTGDTGSTGPAGAAGATGPQGIQGVKGDTGDTGAQGDPGQSVQIKGSVATATSLLTLTPLVGDGYITNDNGHLNVYNGPNPNNSLAKWTDVGNVTGPQGATGATGATGPQGIQGVKGDTGDTGSQGIQGVKGDTGLQGPTGATGTAGTNGSDGATGAQGPIGPTGLTGSQGPIGLTGSQGIQGVQGVKGDTGDTGPQGTQGIQGVKGDTGSQGPTGATGSTGPQGATGPGVAAGGTTAQALTKIDNADYNTQWTTLTKSTVGLANVDNTSDAAKPVSTATQSALDGKQPIDSDLTAIAALAPADTNIMQRKAGAWVGSTPATVKTDLALTKADVGLANVDNTSDAAKPVSTAQATINTAKADKTTTITPTAPLTGGGDLSANRTLDISTFTATVKGAVPPPTTATGKFLKDDGTWAIPADSTTPGAGTITPAMMANADFGDFTIAAAIATIDALAISTGKIADDAVTNAKAANMAANTIKGNNTGLAADPLDLTATQVKTLLAITESDITNLVTDLANKQPLDADLTTIAGLTATTDNILQSVAGVWASRTPAQVKTALALDQVSNTSDANKPVSTATQSALDGKQPIDTDLSTIAGLTATTDNMIQSVAGAWASRTPAQVKAALAITNTDVSGLGSLATKSTIVSGDITDGTVANGDLANMGANTVKGSVAGGVPADLTPANARTVLASDAGVSPTTKFMRGDGTWAVPADSTTPGAGTITPAMLANADFGDFTVATAVATIDALAITTGKIAADAVDNTKLANMAASTFKGNNTAGATDPLDLTVAQAKTLLAITEADVTNLTTDLANKQPLDTDLTTIAGLTATTDNIIQAVGSAWASRTPAQVKTALAITESDVANLTTDLANKQPLDTDLTTIAGLTATTDNMIQSVGSAWASRTPAQVKTALALDQVSNTSDANKPVSTAQAAADALKADKTITITPTAPLTGGGDLSANRTLDISTFTATVKGAVPPPTTATGKFLKDDGTWAAVTASGGGALFGYTFSNSTAAPPASATIRYNNATPASVTTIWIHYTTAEAIDVRTRLLQHGTGEKLYIQDKDSSAIYQIYRLTAAPTDNTTYAALSVVFDSGAGAISNNQAVLAGFLGTALSDGDKGDITIGSSATTFTIDANAVTNAKAAQMAANTIKGNNTAGTANALDLTAAQVKTLLAIASGDVSGLGSLATKSTVASADITDGTVANGDLANMLASTFKGRITASTGAPEDMTVAQATSLLNTFTATLKGLVPPPTTATGKFLKDDGTWAAAGAGSVTGVKTSELTAITGANMATGDLLDLVDISDPTMAVSGTNKRTTLAELVIFLNANGITVSSVSLTTQATGTLQAAQEPAHTGDVTNGAGSLALTIAANVVTNAKAAQMAANTVKGNNTGSTANALDLTVAQMQTLLQVGNGGPLFKFDFSTTITAGPATSTLRLNNSTPASATIVYVNYTSKDVIDLKTRLLAGTAGDRLYIQDKDNSANYRIYELTGAPVDGTTYATVNVVHRGGGGVLWANAEELVAGFISPPITVATSAPASPLTNDIWIDIT